MENDPNDLTTVPLTRHQVGGEFTSGFMLSTGFALTMLGVFATLSDIHDKKKPIVSITTSVVGLILIGLSLKKHQSLNIQYKTKETV